MKAFAASLALATMVTLVACDGSRPELEQRLAELEVVSAQKDSLLQEVMATTQFVGDLASDLAEVRALGAGRPTAASAAELSGRTPAEVRAEVRERMREFTQRLDESEAQLAQSRTRVQNLTRGNAQLEQRLREQVAQFDSTLTALQHVVDGQRVEIAALTEQIDGLHERNFVLTVANEQLEEVVEAITAENNKVYFVAGTERELLEKGIIARRGGVLGLRATVVPGRSLDPELFQELDRMRDSVIHFPTPGKAYRIVSLQDTRYLEVPPDDDNRIRDGLRIASPQGFWAASRYLIVVEM